ncbi:hypothetical protein BC829DRAFT_429942 [Chytridium lagenaria]|nr:hypothetical protein BC829DRAFT_429942 [Chytridium lagenaria]
MSTDQGSKEHRRIPVGILGGTGMVGQRFVTLLENHPYMYIAAIGASSRSAGKTYYAATLKSWKQTTPPPPTVSSMIVQTCDPSHFSSCALVFSGLDSDVAGEVEKAFLNANIPVLSNAKNYRMDPHVPLIVPVVNADHMDVIPAQRQLNNLSKGFLITTPTATKSPVIDGHTESVSVEFVNRPAPSLRPFTLHLKNTLDRMAGNGYCDGGAYQDLHVLDVKLVLLSHNTILGAAGSAILNAEVAVAKGYI